MQIHEDAIFNFVENNYLLTVVIFFLVSALFVNSPIPFATALELMGGYLFGFTHGAVINIIAMFLGSVFGYIIASFLFRAYIEKKLSKYIQKIQREIHRHGISYLISLRFALAVPYFFINYVAGVTRMPFFKFLISTIIGVVPSAVIYAYGGSIIREIGTLEDLFRPRIIIILIILIIFSLMPTWLRLAKKTKNVQ